MSVLKDMRALSKAEFVNTAGEIFDETVAFLSRLSARYSRLLAEKTADLAGEVLDEAEKANSIFPLQPPAGRPAGSPSSGSKGRSDGP